MRFVIPFNPVTKKNSQQIFVNKKTGRAFISPSAKYKQYEKDFMSCVDYDGEPIDYPVEVTATFYMGTHRVCDLTNLEEALDDCLVKCGVLKDDNYTIVVSHDGSRVLYDKENPRTEVEIRRCEICRN